MKGSKMPTKMPMKMQTNSAGVHTAKMPAMKMPMMKSVGKMKK